MNLQFISKMISSRPEECKKQSCFLFWWWFSNLVHWFSSCGQFSCLSFNRNLYSFLIFTGNMSWLSSRLPICCVCGKTLFVPFYVLRSCHCCWTIIIFKHFCSVSSLSRGIYQVLYLLCVYEVQITSLVHCKIKESSHLEEFSSYGANEGVSELLDLSLETDYSQHFGLQEQNSFRSH